MDYSNYFGGFSTYYFRSKFLRWLVAFLYFFLSRECETGTQTLDYNCY